MSKLFKLDWRDLVKGLVVAGLSTLFTSLTQILQVGGQIDWKQLALVALASCLAYLTKNFVTDSDNKLGGKF